MVNGPDSSFFFFAVPMIGLTVAVVQRLCAPGAAPPLPVAEFATTLPTHNDGRCDWMPPALRSIADSKRRAANERASLSCKDQINAHARNQTLVFHNDMDRVIDIFDPFPAGAVGFAGPSSALLWVTGPRSAIVDRCASFCKAGRASVGCQEWCELVLASALACPAGYLELRTAMRPWECYDWEDEVSSQYRAALQQCGAERHKSTEPFFHMELRLLYQRGERCALEIMAGSPSLARKVFLP